MRPLLELLEVADDGALGEIWKHAHCLKCPIPWRPLLVQRPEEALCLLIHTLHIERQPSILRNFQQCSGVCTPHLKSQHYFPFKELAT